MDVKEAVKKAKSHMIDLFDDEEIADVGLEEVELDETSNTWNITVGFSRPWHRRTQDPMTAALLPAYRRSYKVVRINDDSGKVISIMDRILESSRK